MGILTTISNFSKFFSAIAAWMTNRRTDALEEKHRAQGALDEHSKIQSAEIAAVAKARKEAAQHETIDDAIDSLPGADRLRDGDR